MDSPSFVLGVIIGLFLGIVYTHIVINALKQQRKRPLRPKPLAKEDDCEDEYWWKKGKRPPDLD